MVQSGSGTGFPAEAVEGLLALGNVVGKEFQSDEASQIDVFGLVDHAHPAAA